MQNPSDGPLRRKKEKEKGRKRQMRRWALTVLLASFFITALLSLASGEIIETLPMFASIIVLILFVSLGIVFDIIGLAVATADITAFNSMAARRLKAGRKAVWLISNTEKVSSVCNDVIGDIAGVVSGATGRRHRRAAFFRFRSRILALPDADLAHCGDDRRRQGARQAVRRPLQRKNRLLGRQTAVRIQKMTPQGASHLQLGRFRCLSKRSILPPT